MAIRYINRISILSFLMWACQVAIGIGDEVDINPGQKHHGAQPEQAIRLIVPFEIARRHAELWESNPAAEALVKQMMGDLIDDADLKLRWTSRFILQEKEKTPVDDFERQAIREMLGSKDARRFLWSADRGRVVAAIQAHASCVNCHAVKAGETLGFASLRLSRRRDH